MRDHAVPIVRWVGGKSKLLDEIVSRVPASHGRYFEPFAGGAALFFRLAPPRAVISDTCEGLIDLYREVAQDPRAVHAELRCLTSSGDPLAAYYARRAAWNREEERLSWPGALRAATFLYLNKSCFNGLWRVNRSGAFNVPIGKFGSGPSYPSLADLVAAGEALRHAEIYCEDYATVLDRASRGDFVYVDPPYPPRSKTSHFSSYSSQVFAEEAQRTLARRVLALVDRGVAVLVSQADVPLTREIYAGMTLHEVSSPRSVNARGQGRGAVPELLLTGGCA